MLEALKNQEEVLWTNPSIYSNYNFMYEDHAFDEIALGQAVNFIESQADFLKILFPDLNLDASISSPIKSPLKPLHQFQKAIITFIGGIIPGNWYLKCDQDLSVSGSVKARGGIYALLKYANKSLLENGMPGTSSITNLTDFHEVQEYLSKYKIIVGSTGNLGLSIGTIGKKLGFEVEVHMSSDAKLWKIDALRSLGAQVIQHEGNFIDALAIARNRALVDQNVYFVDDENSPDLFMGYAIAAYELKEQMDHLGILCDENHPLFVYIPCGVGGAPSGIAFGLKMVFGNHVHIFTAEPTKAPCMLLSLSTGKGSQIRVEEIGLDGKTLADGLAVSRSSNLAFTALNRFSSGAYTVADEKLVRMLYLLYASDGIFLEPSACASLIGPAKLFYETTGFNYLKDHQILEKASQATHISWGTGGSMMPEDLKVKWIEEGQASSVLTL